MTTLLEEIHVGDIGTKFLVTFKDENGSVIDISGASTRELIIQTPTGVAKLWSLAFETDGTDGQASFTTGLATDLDEAGRWRLQGHLDFGVNEWRSNYYRFRVFPNLSPP